MIGNAVKAIGPKSMFYETCRQGQVGDRCRKGERSFMFIPSYEVCLRDVIWDMHEGPDVHLKFFIRVPIRQTAKLS